MLTGGEPMLSAPFILMIAAEIKNLNPMIRIYIYTAHIHEVWNTFMKLGRENNLKNIDGLHITLHEDVSDSEVDEIRMLQQFPKIFAGKSMRLQVFPDITKRITIIPSFWQRVTFNPWIENCPLPVDEDFKRLTYIP